MIQVRACHGKYCYSLHIYVIVFFTFSLAILLRGKRLCGDNGASSTTANKNIIIYIFLLAVVFVIVSHFSARRRMAKVLLLS